MFKKNNSTGSKHKVILTFLEVVCLIVIAVLLWPVGTESKSLGADPFIAPKVEASSKNSATNKIGLLPYTQIPIKAAMVQLREKAVHFEKGNATGRPADPLTNRLKNNPPTNWNYPKDINPQSSKHEDDSYLDYFAHTDLVDQRRFPNATIV